MTCLLTELADRIAARPCSELSGLGTTTKRKHPTCSAAAVVEYLGDLGLPALLTDLDALLTEATFGGLEACDDAWFARAAALSSRVRAMVGMVGERSCSTCENTGLVPPGDADGLGCWDCSRKATSDA